MTQPLTIGQFAQATGVPARTIRYYEQVGVLPAPTRTAAGYRQYTRQGVHRLLFIRRARALGLPLQHLKALAAALDDGTRASVRPQLLALVRAQLSAVQAQLKELQLLQGQLEQVLRRLLTQRAAGHEGCRCLDTAEDPAGKATARVARARHH
jgi:MerR family transcriptional regulator, copper efflux regulator